MKRGTQRSQGDVLQHVHADHGEAADASPVILQVGGKHVKSPTANASGDVVVLWTDPQGYITPNVTAVQLDGSATSGASGNGTWYTGLGAFKEVDLIFDITATSGTTPTISFFIDTRLDGTGTTNLARLTTIGSAAAIGVHLSKVHSPAEIAILGADAGAGTIRAVGWADDLRIRHTVAGTSPTFTYRVWFSAV